MMDYDELNINAVCFGILCNFPQFCGEERAKEAAELVRALYAERETLRTDLARVTAERDAAIRKYEAEKEDFLDYALSGTQNAAAENTSAIERLRELWFADREGRCVVLPIKIPGWGWYCNDKFPNAISAYFDRPSQVVDCIEDYILRGTKEQAEAALKAREQE